MTFTGRMRLALFLVALLPPIVAVAAVYMYTTGQAAESAQLDAYEAVQKYHRYEERYLSGLISRTNELIRTEQIQSAALNLTAGRAGQMLIEPIPGGVDFLEICDSSGRVLASGHRPALVGETLSFAPAGDQVMRTVEYDRNGRHAAIVTIAEISNGLFLYSGRYLGSGFQEAAAAYTDANVFVSFVEGRDNRYLRFERDELYSIDDSLQAVVAGGADEGFVIALSQRGTTAPAAASLVGVTIIVSIISVLFALTIGWHLTNRAKREIDNLIEASERVAEGDFTTPVMAYEEGEFSLLADSMTNMMSDLRRTQQKLATTEKVAAWQAVGRKIAHEVKNPLTPISVSVDDLRRSFDEKLPEFDKTLKETTGTIKAEIKRMTRLLDEFVSFARMSPPELQDSSLQHILERLRALYRHELAASRVIIDDRETNVTLTVDPDRVQQVLVNLIKNALETGRDTVVSISVAVTLSDITITVTDTGPGFPPELLDNAFEPQVSKKRDGFGLGLVICQRIIHDHGGTITLQNDPEGARIEIQLPRNHA